MSEREFRQTIAQWLNVSRVAAGLSQTQVADAVKVSPSTVAMWEKGETTMSSLNERRLAKFFG